MRRHTKRPMVAVRYTIGEVQAQLREGYHALEKESSMELSLPRPVVLAPDLARE